MRRYLAQPRPAAKRLIVAVLFVETSPHAETSPDAGRPRLIRTPAAPSPLADVFVEREEHRSRAVAQVLCAA
jgi:hypothetical protein